MADSSHHDRTASDRTLNAAATATAQGGNSQSHAEDDQIAASTTPAEESSEDASTPTPTAPASLFLGQQVAPSAAVSSASSSTPRPQAAEAKGTPPRTGAGTSSRINSSSGTALLRGKPHTVGIPSTHAAIPSPLASPAVVHAAGSGNQAALGRGRAPTLQSQASSSFMAASSGSPNARQHAQGGGIAANLPPVAVAAGRPTMAAGHGHRSMPSTSASLAFSDAPASASYYGQADNLTESESVLSGGEEDVYHTASGRQPRPAVLFQVSTTGVARATSRPSNSTEGGRPTLRPSASTTRGAKSRTRSRSKMRDDTESSSDDGTGDMGTGGRKAGASGGRNTKTPDDSVNVLPISYRNANASRDEYDDDEVERRDRGEELVRRRMRERKKEKKNAEKRERKRREDEIKRVNDRDYSRQQKAAGVGQRDSIISESQASEQQQYTERPSLSRRSTDPTMLGGSGPPTGVSRMNIPRGESSLSTAIPSPYSPPASASYWPPPHTNSGLLSSVRTPQSPFFPQHVQQGNQQTSRGQGNRTISYATSHASFQPSHRGMADVFSDAEGQRDSDRMRDAYTRDGGNSAVWREDVARSLHSQEAAAAVASTEDAHSNTAGPSIGDEGEGENEEDEDEEEEEEDSQDGVEYTLKDRQDAINIEHPFGLPIWKPALYKKQRSVHRNAEKELHSAPSQTAEYHLLPGNILWTLLFGWWMALLCLIFSFFLCIVPFGGMKYGRVIWELAGYLFWPFGKYVERTDDEELMHDLKGYDEMSDDGEDTIYEETRARDIEDAGKTWGRQSGRSTSSAGTIKRAAARDAFEGHLDASQQEHVEATPSKANNRSVSYASEATECTQLTAQRTTQYGAVEDQSKPQNTPSGSETEVAEGSPIAAAASPQSADSSRQFRVRASGRISYWLIFYLLIAPMMMIVCILCWAFVFTIPMAKLLWILVRDLGKEPLALHFRSPSPHYAGNNAEPDNGALGTGLPHLEAGQRAPRHSRKTYDRSRAMGRFLGPNSTIILCTYKAMGFKYYKYTIDGTNIIFINLLPLIAFVIFDFFVIAPQVEKHHIDGFLGFIAAQATMFTLALLSVIPLSYFIGMAVASISAQSSIGMGAVINATFGSIIEIILYGIALTQSKGQLVEGSIVGSLLAGVLLMPGLSMIGGAFRRKEQRFNARSAGVTSTMLIMAIIGILTPTLFYEIYGSFQLRCESCPVDNTPDNFSCRRCFYEHVDPVDDDFYLSNVKPLSYYCAILLVLSYLIGLWFSLRTHASQIWQNQQQQAPVHPAVQHSAALAHLAQTAGLPTSRLDLPHRSSTYKKTYDSVGTIGPVPHARQITAASKHPGDTSIASTTKGSLPRDNKQQESTAKSPEQPGASSHPGEQAFHSIAGFTAEEVNRAFHVMAATASALQQSQHGQPGQQAVTGLPQSYSNPHNLTVANTSTPALRRQSSHMQHDREISKGGEAHDEGGGGHDAPNWSRSKSYSVLFGCTVLYAIIAEILVDVVDVVLDGSGIPEKFLGITLFALVPNTTEFMNAISFAMNGNIALSMEIGSAYGLQVCLLQAPAMVAFTYFYSMGKDSMLHKAFTLVFPRWDAIAIMFSVFLLTYTYIEARSNYYRGSILVLSYMVLLGAFYWAPAGRDTSDDPLMLSQSLLGSESLSLTERLQALFFTIFTR